MVSYKLSHKFRVALKLHDRPAYKICQEAGVDPILISKYMKDRLKVRYMDKRVIAVGKILGIPAEKCFQDRKEK